MESPLARVCTLLLTATTRLRLYGDSHRLTRDAGEALWSALDAELATSGELRLTVSGDEILADDQRLDATSGAGQALVQRLASRGIALLELYRGLGRVAHDRFLRELADPESRVTSQTHLVVGAAEALRSGVAIPESLRVREVHGTRSGPVSEEATRLAGMVRHVAEHRELRARDAGDIVLALLAHLASQGNVFLNVAEVREHSLYTYLHTCNVATLGMGFAVELGIPARDAHEIGIAALLHDIGKTFVPREVLDKPGPLDEEEWELVRLHPWIGARLLMRQRDVPHLAVVAAYEHHMHWRGSGGYPRAPFRPSRLAQIIAVVDTFDALFSRRSYHAELDVLQALEILQNERGRIYDPELVDAFCRFATQQLDQVRSPA